MNNVWIDGILPPEIKKEMLALLEKHGNDVSISILDNISFCSWFVWFVQYKADRMYVDFSEKLIEFLGGSIEWDYVSSYSVISKDFVRRHSDKINFDRLAKNKNFKMTKAFRKEFIDKFSG